ncbi:VOC family protein [Aerococcaceae bacterium WGS1372]
MTVEAITQSSTTIYTSGIELNALNPKALAEFYQHKIGLSLLHTDAEQNIYQLGTAEGVLLITIYPTEIAKVNRTTGLYHLALLLPSRSDLGGMLRHLIENQVALEGASDHGYSEALYLSDPEGNGIEIYADKDSSVWDKYDNGLTGGIVEPMDAEGVLASQKRPFKGIPKGTTMGHIHIHVGNIGETLEFYHEVLGLGLKFIMNEQALFMATQDYHHHLGANLWNGRNIPAAQVGTQGLRNSIWSGTKKDVQAVEDKLKAKNYTYSKEDGTLHFTDSAGTGVILTVAS